MNTSVAPRIGTTKRVLVFMPMLPGYEALRGVVAKVIRDAKLELVWLNELIEDWEWLDWLYSSIGQCDFIIADPSKHNAFVMYELGVTQQAKRPTLIMLGSENSQLSGSLDGSSFLLYSHDKLEEFSVMLRADLKVLVSSSMKKTVALDLNKCYRIAKHLISLFILDSGRGYQEVSMEAFLVRIRHSVNRGTFIPGLLGTPLGDTALLTALIKPSRMADTMALIRLWAYRNNF